MNQNLAQFARMAAPRPQMPMGPPMGGPMGLPPMPPGMLAGPGPSMGMPPGPPPAPPGAPAGMPSGMGQGQPPMPPQGAPPPPSGPNLAAHAASVIRPLAAQGRGGDTLVAHMTPGEIAVPPQIQTPDVLAKLNEAFAKAGANPTSFQAGSPDQKINPNTGIPEFSFFDTVLPIALGVAGSAFLGPEVLAPALASAGIDTAAGGIAGALPGLLGGAIGTTAGNLIEGQPFGTAAASGIGSGIGSALGSAAGGSLFGSGPAPTPSVMPNSVNDLGALDNTQFANLVNKDTSSSFLNDALDKLNLNNPGKLAGSALGGIIGSNLGQSLVPTQATPPTVNNGPPLTPLWQLPPISNFVGGGAPGSSGGVSLGNPRRPPISYRPGIDPQFSYFGP